MCIALLKLTKLELQIMEALGTPSDVPADTTPANFSGPSIFIALQEQLGLKLESIRAAVETIVIDRAERPSAN